MSSWGMQDANTSAPLWAVTQAHVTPDRANTNTFFNSANTGAFLTREAIGLFGVSNTEIANTQGEGNKVTHSGWNTRIAGTGPIIAINIITSGNGYSNGFITFTAGNGPGQTSANTAANASVAVDSNGNLVSITINTGGNYTTTPTTALPGAGANGSVSVVMGGRANRVQYETLVVGKIIGDSVSDNTILPGV